MTGGHTTQYGTRRTRRFAAAMSAWNTVSCGHEQRVVARTLTTTTTVFRKDEFGRDVEEKQHVRLEHEEENDTKKTARRRRKKHKKHKRRRDTSSSSNSSNSNSSRLMPSSPRGRLVGTPPPPDPFRPQVGPRDKLDVMPFCNCRD